MAQLQSLHGYYLWQYVPSLPAAIIFLVLFLATSTFHLWKMCKTRTRFCLAFVIGGFFEVIGYAARAASHDKTGKIMPYAIQNVFILLAAVLFAATVYMTLGRIIRSIHAEKQSPIRPNWLTKIFVMGDVCSFLIQGSASGLMATGNNASLGENIVIAGLVLQVVMFGLFIVTAAVFQMNMRRSPTQEAFSELPWKRHLYTLYTVSALIMIRSIFRVVEYAMGNTGYLLKHEWTLYVFDGTLMFIVMVVFGICYPDQLQIRPVEQELLQTKS